MQRNIVIAIDPRTGAGARVVRNDLDTITRKAREAEAGMGRYSAAQVRARAASVNLAAGLSSLRGALAGVGVVLSASKVIEYSDAYTRMTNALKVAGHEGKNLTAVYQQLLDSAQRNAAPIESLVTLYGRASLVQKELGVSTQELISFTDRVALALRVAGTDAQSASGALLQLSQALGSGIVRAEEFNSILEGALPVAQAAAAGLEEAGGSVAKLRSLVIDGKVSSEAFFRAFEAGAPMLEQKVAGAVLTIDQRMTNLQTALIDAAGRFNNSTQAANTFGEAIDNVTGFVNGIDFDNLISQITAVIEAMQTGISTAYAWAESIAQASGLEGVGHWLTDGKVQREFLGGALTIQSTQALRERIDGALAGPVNAADPALQGQLERLYGGVAPRGGRVAGNDNFTPTRTSLKDNPVVGDGSGTKAKISDYQRLTESIRDATREYQVEAEVIGMTEKAAETYRVEQDLLNAALRSGKTDSEALRAEIEKTAGAYAAAKFEAERLKQMQDAMAEAGEGIGSILRNLVDGTLSFRDALTQAIPVLLRFLNQANLANGGQGIFGGGLVQGLLQSFIGFSDGGVFQQGNVTPFARGGIVMRPTLFPMANGAGLMGEAGPEAVMPLRRLPSGRLGVEAGGSGATNVAIGGTTITINGSADRAAIDDLKRYMDERDRAMKRDLPKVLDSRNKEARVRKTRA